ncbi:hypothetical protein JJQ72_16140 [Paenibacillus sp. F411]|uniref:Uncharacterized protein n=1 Tax=Paenibacillus algicola TaxID=2565926 RepID=A0A4V1G4C6_9BACL|nr:MULTISPECIES: hypothetical protein [Paenibacillus]MBO2945508.1 hypothetical protein [Paenibacillus sp. F411]QCT04224.1 hypothetical protein E6C60_3514 [Paenibacillus algicola]
MQQLQPTHKQRRSRSLSPGGPGFMSRRRRKLPALLLAAIIPGLGHIYLGLYRKGLLFVLLLMLDISALLYFSSIGMQINVPLLMLLGLLVPAGYFYNVYDVLQTADYLTSRKRRAEEQVTLHTQKSKRPELDIFRGAGGLSFGLMLVAGGALLMLLHQRPPWLQAGIRDYGNEIAALTLVAAGFIMGIREMLKHKKRL